MKRDLYGHEQRYANWKEEVLKNGEPELTKKNSDILLKFVFDMELGINVSSFSRKGARSAHRLNAVRHKLTQIFKMLQERGVKDITKVKREVLMQLFADMRNGTIKTRRGTIYKCTGDYVKDFKAFWNWWIKINRLKNPPIKIDNITEDISREGEKPKWVYMDEEQIKKVLKNSIEKYAPLFEFAYCSGARPTEIFSVLGRDITKEKNGIYVTLREEASKTFGRKIKLQLSGETILKYIKDNQIKEEDYLFPFSVSMVNQYLKEICKKLFGDKVSQAGNKYSEFSLYDFRHNSACFWVQRYKRNSDMMYRFGWKSEKYIFYYSEFLGMRDKIRDEDMYVDITKTELEKRISELEKFKDEQKKIIDLQREAYALDLQKLIPKMKKRILEDLQKGDKILINGKTISIN